MKTVHKKSASIGRGKQTQETLACTSKAIKNCDHNYILPKDPKIKHATHSNHYLRALLCKTWISTVPIPCLFQDPFTRMYVAKGQTETYMRCINYTPAHLNELNTISVRNLNHTVRLPPGQWTDHFRKAFSTLPSFFCSLNRYRCAPLLESFSEQKRVNSFECNFARNCFQRWSIHAISFGALLDFVSRGLRFVHFVVSTSVCM